MECPSAFVKYAFLYLCLFLFCSYNVARCDLPVCADNSAICSDFAALTFICQDRNMGQFCNKSCGLCRSISISFTDQTENIQYGAEVRFQCVAGGGGDNITISWRTGKGPLPPNVDIKHGGQTLVIPVFEPRDHEDYICVVSDGTNTAQHVFHIPPMASPPTTSPSTIASTQQSTKTTTQKLLHCKQCTGLTDPNDCNVTTICSENEVCYSEAYYVHRQIRFRMGCVHSQNCLNHTYIPYIPEQAVGKRESQSDSPGSPHCAKCCDHGDLCNKDLCNSIVTTDSASSTPTGGCLESPQCATYKDLFCDPYNPEGQRLCPVTCGLCRTSTTMSTSTMAPSTSAPGGCVDLPQCSKYKQFFCDPSHPEGQKVCPITCGTCGTPTVTVNSTTTTSTTTHTTTTTTTTRGTTTKMPTVSCVDAPECSKYKQFFCDPGHPEGAAMCPNTCGTSTCVKFYEGLLTFAILSVYFSDVVSGACVDLASDCDDPSMLTLICAQKATSSFCKKSCSLCGSPNTTTTMNPLQIVFTDQTQNIQIGSEVRLQCFAQGTSTPVMSWKTSSGPLPANVMVLNNGGTLVIPRFSPEDNTEFTCVASDGSYSVEHTFHVQAATSAPTVKQNMTTTTVQETTLSSQTTTKTSVMPTTSTTTMPITIPTTTTTRVPITTMTPLTTTATKSPTTTTNLSTLTKTKATTATTAAVAAATMTNKGSECLKCTGVKNPHSCSAIVQCQQNQKCGTRKYRTKYGAALFDLGCLDQWECDPAGLIIGKRSEVRRRKHHASYRAVGYGQTILCKRCCTGRLCNTGDQCGIYDSPATIYSTMQVPNPAHVGDNVTLYCLSSGFPSPRIDWKILPSISHSWSNPNNVKRQSDVIIISSLSLANDRIYKCTASNSVGIDHREFPLIIE